MCKLQDKGRALEADLAHLAQEMTRIAHTTHPVGSAARQYAKQEFRELEATYHSKVQELGQLGRSLVLASLSDQVRRAAAAIEGTRVHRCLGPAPSAAGGVRFVEEVWVSPDMMLALFEALDELDGHVLSQRPSGRYPNSPLYFTVSLASARDLFQLGTFTVLCHHVYEAAEGSRRG